MAGILVTLLKAMKKNPSCHEEYIIKVPIDTHSFEVESPKVTNNSLTCKDDIINVLPGFPQTRGTSQRRTGGGINRRFLEQR